MPIAKIKSDIPDLMGRILELRKEQMWFAQMQMAKTEE